MTRLEDEYYDKKFPKIHLCKKKMYSGFRTSTNKTHYPIEP